ncbi:MAG: rhodanese-like domain-containing protein [Pseudomonadota bacterium]
MSPSYAQFEGGSFEDTKPSNEVERVTPPPIPGGDQDDALKGSFDDIEPEPEKVVVTPEPEEKKEPEKKENEGEQPSKWTGILQFETRDYGIAPTNQLRTSNFHAPTPTSIPGGKLITTTQLANAMQQGQQLILIDVLGGNSTLPNAYAAPAMASPGHYRDRIQQQTAQWLGQITSSNRQFPLVVSCSDPFCWLSYNASLRAIAAGYTNVYWYRGGLQAWSMAGLPLRASGF